MALTFSRDHAIVPLGRQFATVVDEPCYKQTKINGRMDYVAHFPARGRSGELIECIGLHERAKQAAETMNVGDQVVVDVSAKITAIENNLEYAYTGYFICVDIRK